MTPVSVEVGDKVLLPEYGGTKLVLEDQVCANHCNKRTMQELVGVK